MRADPSTQLSFSPRRKWSIAFNVGVALIAVLALVVMANYLSGRVFKRYYVSSHQNAVLSPRTISILNSVTNRVQVTLYYQKDDELYSTLSELLREYQNHNRKISLRFVDYLRDTAAAHEVSAKYELGSATNLIIFSVEGKRPWIIPGDDLMQLKVIQVPTTNGIGFERRREAFRGEVAFSAALLAVTEPKQLKVYYVNSEGEHAIDTSKYGYSSFVGALFQNYLQVQELKPIGTNAVPPDCDLLIVAGPDDPMLPSVADNISRYLSEGGRMLAMFSIVSTNKDIGLENVLTNWGVNVSRDVVVDPAFYEPQQSGSILVFEFPKHPAVNALNGRPIQFLLPRMISKMPAPAAAGDSLKVDEIIHSSRWSYLATDPLRASTNLPIAVAVEQTSQTTRKPRGLTRILVVGDSIFLSDRFIGMGANRDFASLAVNWLLERNALLEGVGPQPVNEYRLVMTDGQMRSAKWILLVGMPGGVLLIGGLIWLRRRK